MFPVRPCQVRRKSILIPRTKGQCWTSSTGWCSGLRGLLWRSVISDNIFNVVSFISLQGLWSNNLRDTDAGLFQIYQACVDAGPSVCPIYESSVSEINARVNNLLEKLRIQPLYFYNTSTGAYGTLDYSAAKTSIFSVLYDTHHAGARLSHALAEAERGAGQPLYDVSARAVQSAALQCNSTGAPLNLPAAIRYESTLAVACGDAGSVGATLEEMREYYEEMGRSSVFAEVWWMRIACV